MWKTSGVQALSPSSNILWSPTPPFGHTAQSSVISPFIWRFDHCLLTYPTSGSWSRVTRIQFQLWFLVFSINWEFWKKTHAPSMPKTLHLAQGRRPCYVVWWVQPVRTDDTFGAVRNGHRVAATAVGWTSPCQTSHQLDVGARLEQDLTAEVGCNKTSWWCHGWLSLILLIVSYRVIVATHAWLLMAVICQSCRCIDQNHNSLSNFSDLSAIH